MNEMFPLITVHYCKPMERNVWYFVFIKNNTKYYKTWNVTVIADSSFVLYFLLHWFNFYEKFTILSCIFIFVYRKSFVLQKIMKGNVRIEQRCKKTDILADYYSSWNVLLFHFSIRSSCAHNALAVSLFDGKFYSKWQIKNFL